MACVVVFTILFLPETQGKYPEELAAELAQTNSETMVYEIDEEETGNVDEEWRKAMDQLSTLKQSVHFMKLDRNEVSESTS